jgi:hypothetical protein
VELAAGAVDRFAVELDDEPFGVVEEVELVDDAVEGAMGTDRGAGDDVVGAELQVCADERALVGVGTAGAR